MKSARSLFVSGLVALIAGPALAQPGPGHMWGDGWAWHPGMAMGPLVMLLALVGIISLIVWLVRALSRERPRSDEGRRRVALDILEERFARGEIGKDEFEEKRRLLGR